MIRRSDRLLLVGHTGCGKSTVARMIAQGYDGPLLIIDPADSTITDLPGARQVRGPAARGLRDQDVHDQVVAALEAAAEARVIRWVPGEADRLSEYDAVYRWAFGRRYPGLVWLDEAGIAAPANGCPRAVTTYLVQGRKRRLAHLACHTRPREISRNLIAQAQHVLVWNLPNPDDVKAVADQAGIPAAELAERLRQLPEHGYVYFDQRTHQLVDIEPVRYEK